MTGKRIASMIALGSLCQAYVDAHTKGKIFLGLKLVDGSKRWHSKQGVTFTTVPPCADDDEGQECSEEDYDSGHAVDSGGGRQDGSSATETDDDEQDPMTEDDSGEYVAAAEEETALPEEAQTKDVREAEGAAAAAVQDFPCGAQATEQSRVLPVCNHHQQQPAPARAQENEPEPMEIDSGSTRNRRPSSSSKRCRYCKKTGHVIEQCFKLKNKENHSLRWNFNEGSFREERCRHNPLRSLRFKKLKFKEWPLGTAQDVILGKPWFTKFQPSIDWCSHEILFQRLPEVPPPQVKSVTPAEISTAGFKRKVKKHAYQEVFHVKICAVPEYGHTRTNSRFSHRLS
ncbi:hypothetical protein ON010_g11873 [Phytophthora cinnamomi]|nr:hypothetical protein ON010_g11873 [Phytophthora cinnamomi]